MTGSWDYEVFWTEVHNQLRPTISDQEYETWFKNMVYHGSAEGEIQLQVPSSFYRDQVVQRFQSVIEGALLDLSGQTLKLSFLVPAVGQENGATPPRARPRARAFIHSGRRPAPQAACAGAPGYRGPRAPRRRHGQLNPQYNFERLVEGDGNSFALNAALAIAKNPGRAYNPCLVYGGVGLGKTHLLQAVGNAVHHDIPDQKVVYVTVETFTNEFIQSIKEKTGPPVQEPLSLRRRPADRRHSVPAGQGRDPAGAVSYLQCAVRRQQANGVHQRPPGVQAQGAARSADQPVRARSQRRPATAELRNALCDHAAQD